MSEDGTTTPQIDSTNADLDELVEEIVCLRERNAYLESIMAAETSAAKVALGLTGYLLIGPGLAHSFHSLLKAIYSRKALPLKETADVAAAIVRRMIRIGFLGILVASLPIVLLFWQNVEIRKQNAAIQDQMDRQHRVTIQQAIFLDGRNKQQALVEYIELQDDKKFLAGVHLDGCILERGFDLSEADLRKAFLIDAFMSGVILDGADLEAAELIRTDLSGARLRKTNLRNAKLVLANLRNTDLSNADMRNSVLNGADLTNAILKGTNLNGATYQQSTKWPTGFDPEAAGAIADSE